MSTVHVIPRSDLVGHIISDGLGEGCACGPTAEPVKQDDGSVCWLMVHHSLDGRELSE